MLCVVCCACKSLTVTLQQERRQKVVLLLWRFWPTCSPKKATRSHLIWFSEEKEKEKLLIKEIKQIMNK
jgi:hypothetical protein